MDIYFRYQSTFFLFQWFEWGDHGWTAIYWTVDGLSGAQKMDVGVTDGFCMFFLLIQKWGDGTTIISIMGSIGPVVGSNYQHIVT